MKLNALYKQDFAENYVGKYSSEIYLFTSDGDTSRSLYIMAFCMLVPFSGTVILQSSTPWVTIQLLSERSTWEI